ncbi:LLM class flavin-dependent oxidoreductase [Amorphus sp. 3PC139-8]|uniref:LLM class flavin-dependent oxidoreductase n=1 Tax=Amorphus sp. 3PC139-8 TaxID=2735676 RepID=UPI00345CDA65
MSHGRFEFAVGRGIVPYEVALWGINPFESHEMLKEVNEVLMQPLVDGKGHYYRLFKIEMQVEPYQKPHPPMWITSGSPDAATIHATRQPEI